MESRRIKPKVIRKSAFGDIAMLLIFSKESRSFHFINVANGKNTNLHIEVMGMTMMMTMMMTMEVMMMMMTMKMIIILMIGMTNDSD